MVDLIMYNSKFDPFLGWNPFLKKSVLIKNDLK
jgi:hypothetical protein